MIKKILPIGIIIVVWAIFSIPFFMHGRVPFPSDYQVANFSPWSAYPEFYGPVKNESMPDVIGQIYPWKMFTIETIKTGTIPFWNPYSFSGTPHLANYQSAVLSPFNLGFFLFPFVDWWSFLIILQPLLAGIFTYMFLRSLKVAYPGSLISSLSFMFCGFITSWMAYGTLGYAILFLPLALYAIEKYKDTKSSRYLVLLCLAIPLSFFSGHFQTSIYFLIFTFAYMVFITYSKKNLRLFLNLFLSLFFGFLFVLPQLLPSMELYSQTIRSTINQKTEAIPWGYLPTIIAPDYFGNPVTRNAWFGHYAEWNGYIGLIPMFFAFYAFSLFRKSTVLFFMGTLGIAFLFAYDTPVLDALVLLKVPVLSTSAASRVIVLFSFSASVLAGFGLNRLIDDLGKKHVRKSILFLGIFAFLFLILWVIAVQGMFAPDQFKTVAFSNLKFPSILFLSFVVGLLTLIFTRKKRIVTVIICFFVFLVALEMLRFTTKWMPFSQKDRVYPSAPVTKFYPKIEGYNRVFGNFGAEGSLYYHLPTIEGYDPVYIRRYGQFIGSLQDGKLSESYRSVVEMPLAGKYTLLGANLLGIKYFIHKISDGQNVWEFPFWKYNAQSIKLIYKDPYYEVLENTNAFPRVFFVENIVVKKDAQELLSEMFKKSTNLRKTAIVEDELKEIKAGDADRAQIQTYTPNKVKIRTESKKKSFLVLTDPYYPGWEAFIDGRKTKIYRVDFALRGVVVPSGVHRVEFVYIPYSFWVGVCGAGLGIIGILGLIILNNKKAK